MWCRRVFLNNFKFSLFLFFSICWIWSRALLSSPFILKLLEIFNKHFKIKNVWAERIVTGGISGILNGSVSFSGPPMVIFLSNKGVEKQQFRANLTFYFWILNVMTIPTFIIGGLITSQTIIFTFSSFHKSNVSGILFR